MIAISRRVTEQDRQTKALYYEDLQISAPEPYVHDDKASDTLQHMGHTR